MIDAMGTLIALQPPAPALAPRAARALRLEVSAQQAQRAIAAEIAYYRAHMHEGRDAAHRGRAARALPPSLRGALPAATGLPAVSGAALTEALLASLRFDAFADARPALGGPRRRGTAGGGGQQLGRFTARACSSARDWRRCSTGS